ncbi:hypothetical protein FKZ61_021195 [Litorilinea aerophila]|uniref:Uncharacterized protein n=1 Tax=Litorilinea aerophila TaxID=1204385 RepID=A0A540V9V9_9CHLR|nr:hypothetical protein [Litorilinea aerophila]MCC9078618.1 hypothetical protein [Litorilinea aerophila]OUC09783.1 hypothetical protein RY27_00735 [Litorilinea aerophila]
MNMRRWLLLLLILLLVLVYKPRGLWQEFRRIYSQRDTVLKVLVFVIAIYFLYGLYSMYERGMLPWFE